MTTLLEIEAHVNAKRLVSNIVEMFVQFDELLSLMMLFIGRLAWQRNISHPVYFFLL